MKGGDDSDNDTKKTVQDFEIMRVEPSPYDYDRYTETIEKKADGGTIMIKRPAPASPEWIELNKLKIEGRRSCKDSKNALRSLRALINAAGASGISGEIVSQALVTLDGALIMINDLESVLFGKVESRMAELEAELSGESDQT